MTFDELEAADFQETGIVQVQRQSLGRSSEEMMMARRLHVLNLYSNYRAALSIIKRHQIN